MTYTVRSATVSAHRRPLEVFEILADDGEIVDELSTRREADAIAAMLSHGCDECTRAVFDCTARPCSPARQLARERELSRPSRKH